MIACKRTALPLIVDASPRGRRAPRSEKPHAPDSRNGLWRRRFRGVTFVHRRRPAARTTGRDAAADRQTRPRYQLRHTDVTLLGDAGPMCGIAGEIRFDGHDADVAAVARINEAMHRRGPDGIGRARHGTGRVRPPPAQDPRPLRVRRAADGRQRAGPDHRLQRPDLQLPRSSSEELQGHGYRFFSTTDTEVLLKAFHKWGPACVERFLGHVRLRHPRPRHRRAHPRAATGSGSSRCTTPRPRTGCGSPRGCRRCWRAARSTRRSTRSRCTTT